MGYQGIQGELGYQGIQGEQGVQGIQGIQGILGIQGMQGDQGEIGKSTYDIWYEYNNIQSVFPDPSSPGAIALFIRSLQGIQGCRGPAGQSSVVPSGGGGGGCGCGCDGEHFETKIKQVTQDSNVIDVPRLLYEVYNDQPIFINVEDYENLRGKVDYDTSTKQITVTFSGTVAYLVIEYEYVEEGDFILMGYKLFEATSNEQVPDTPPVEP